MNLDKDVDIDLVEIANEEYFCISNVDAIRPFFMSIVSDWNHWMFISSNGGLTAGRKNAEYALFPYYTDDKITESAEHTGSKTIIRIKRNMEVYLWEPFSVRSAGKYQIVRNLYKSKYGNKLLFEEINADLNLTFRYEWCSSRKYGFVRKASLLNQSDKGITVSCLDGLQNILPAGVPSDLQNKSSNLVDAYKRTELHEDSGLAIYALSAVIVDRAEPSEALRANVGWSQGLNPKSYLLSSNQLDRFRSGKSLIPETDVKGERGAYFVHEVFQLPTSTEKNWSIISDVNLNHARLFELIEIVKNNKNIKEDLVADIDNGTKELIKLNASGDGIQLTSDKFRDARHFTNVFFNIMRGGIFDDAYQIKLKDFKAYLEHANKQVLRDNLNWLDKLDDKFSLHHLNTLLQDVNDNDLKRLAIEYLPIKFSRRHGDPSRPWNRFSINMVNEQGEKVLDYEGNWRDIFQNWEAMVHAYPDFIEGMIFRFLNASTFDGYNPYRITKGGFDWESIEPDDPWSYIGYWGDHQIIYLLKFLEFINDHQPGKLARYFSEDLFVYANVPYKIKHYKEILQNPKDTIIFDDALDSKLRSEMESSGADASLLHDQNGEIYHVNFLEKILATLMAKISNLVPEAGIWMNTQRPEWNDANNALVGNGVSMVTLYYLRRFLVFFKILLKDRLDHQVNLSGELFSYFSKVFACFRSYEGLFTGASISDKDRKSFVDELGLAACEYRTLIYKDSFTKAKHKIGISEIYDFISLSLKLLEHTILANKRNDGMYHSYNLISINDDSIAIDHLSVMLEGQVAILSSGYLDTKQALSLLDSLKESALFRHDQYSYMLYPNKELPGFLQRNLIDESLLKESRLVAAMLVDEDTSIIERDIKGQLHFNSNFRNADHLKGMLNGLRSGKYQHLVEEEEELLLDAYEEVFNHKSFTGRSGTFYAYEGLGSIYWHMVSKLLLAVEETSMHAVFKGVDATILGRILEHYYEINEGIGVHKSPSLYGAFSTDPYSHTPAHKGAQQPGMTGQVKEDILSRFGELGVYVNAGCLHFYPCLLRKNEFLNKSHSFIYYDVKALRQQIKLDAGQLAFTYCQVPVIYKISDAMQLMFQLNDGQTVIIDDYRLNADYSKQIFRRAGRITCITVGVDKSILK
jgi:hypothetical protein